MVSTISSAAFLDASLASINRFFDFARVSAAHLLRIPREFFTQVFGSPKRRFVPPLVFEVSLLLPDRQLLFSASNHSGGATCEIGHFVITHRRCLFTAPFAADAHIRILTRYGHNGTFS